MPDELLTSAPGSPESDAPVPMDPSATRSSTSVRAARDEDTFPPGAKIARYTVLEAVGSGGIGIVYACYDPDLDRKVAVKLLRPSKLAGDPRSIEIRQGRMLREAKALARLSHPNVVPIYEVGTLGAQIYLVMEFVEGTTLNGWLKRRRHDWRKVVETFVQAGRGLAAAHAAGIVHRDFKPDNVLVGLDGRVRVLDLGLATPLRDDDASRRTDDGEDHPEGPAEPPAQDPDDDPAASRSQRLERMVADVRDSQQQPNLVTREGQVMGTPAYMAPEQAAGGVVDERSDQFSLCVAMYEALYRSRPFPGAHLDPQRYRDLTRLRSLPGQRPADMPAKIEKVLLRGLSLDPDARHPSVAALVEELTDVIDERGRSWVPAAMVAVAALVLGAVVWLVVSRDRVEPITCDDGAAKLRSVWTASIADEFAARLDGSHLPYAGKTFETVDARLDRFAERWQRARRQTCEATHVHHEQSKAVLERRMACLDRQLARVQVVVSDLRTEAPPADELLARMQKLSARLPDPERCDAATVLSQAEIEPNRATDPAFARSVEALRQRIAQAQGLTDAGRFALATGQAEAIVTDARELDYDPVMAEALYTLGRVMHWHHEDSEVAISHLREAALLAQRSGHDVAFVQAATELVPALSRDGGKIDQAELWADLGLSSLTRLGDDPLLEVELQISLGDLAMTKGDFEAALASHQRVLEVMDDLGGAQHPRYAAVLIRIGDASRELGQFDVASEALTRALEVVVDQYGPKHPDVAGTLDGLGNVRAGQGQFEQALAFHRQSLELSEELSGPRHPDVARTLNNMAIIFDEAGRYGEAAETLERAREIIVEHMGDEHPDVAFIDVNLGSALQNLGRYGEAIERYEAALAVLEPSLGADHIAVGVALQNLAAAQAERGELEGERNHFREALVDFEAARTVLVAALGESHPALASLEHNRARALRGLDRLDEAFAAESAALAIKRETFGDEHPALVEALVGASVTELARERHAQAVELGERAVKLSALEGNKPVDVAAAHLALARALAADPDADETARARALDLGNAGLAALAEAEGATLVRRGLVEWLTAQGVDLPSVEGPAAK